jgi:tetratricopeptide (TPR) repeat protein
MWDLAVREADYQAAAAMLGRLKQIAPPPSMRILLTYARGDSAARARVFEEARALDSRQSQIAARYVALFLEDFAAAESLARLDLAPRRPPAIRVTAQLTLAWLEIARGRWRAAETAFAQVERMEDAPLVLVQLTVLVQRAVAATLPFLLVPRADLESIRDDVERWNVATDGLDPNARLTARLRPQLRLYLLGLLSSRLGDREAALRYAEDIDRADGPPEARAVVRALAQTVRADVALESGNVDGAASALQTVTGEVPLELVSVPPFAPVRVFTQEHARHLRVIVLTAQQEYAEALRWIDASFQRSPSEIVYAAPMHLQRAEIYERLGEREKAAEHYRRFVTLWRDCDPALRPRVEEAKARLARLDVGGG